MPRKNTRVLIVILAIFTFAISALAYPLLGRDGMRLGLDLQGGLHLVYKLTYPMLNRMMKLA